MRRVLPTLLVTLFIAWLPPGTGEAQQTVPPERSVSQFDFGLNAGGAFTTPWFESRTLRVEGGQTTQVGDTRKFGIGLAPIFGAHATLWTTPTIGVRLHGALMPSQLPAEREGTFDFSRDGDGRALHNWFYDLNLVLRPWIMRNDVGNALASTYLFLGGGGLTTDVRDLAEQTCEPTLRAQGACLSGTNSHASVGQGVVGAGIGLFPLTRTLGLFAELAAHGYSAPSHVGDDWLGRAEVPAGGTVNVADNAFAVTTRLNAGINFAFGDMRPPPPPPPPAPAPTPAPEPAPPVERAITVCVIDGTVIREVDATFVPETGDTVVMVQGQRRPFSQVHPTDAQYAVGQQWFVQEQPVMFQDRRYVKFGLPRVVSPDQLAHIGTYQGVTVWGEAGVDRMGDAPEVIYIPVRPGCEFQPYQAEEEIRVRG